MLKAPRCHLSSPAGVPWPAVSHRRLSNQGHASRPATDVLLNKSVGGSHAFHSSVHDSQVGGETRVGTLPSTAT